MVHGRLAEIGAQHSLSLCRKHLGIAAYVGARAGCSQAYYHTKECDENLFHIRGIIRCFIMEQNFAQHVHRQKLINVV